MIKTFIFIVCCILSLGIYAQQVAFTYDRAGNRISRKVEVSVTGAPLAGEAEEYVPGFEVRYEAGVMPNPTTGIFRVEIRNNTDETEFELHLYDASGKRVESRKTRQFEESFDITEQPSGFYFLKITGEGYNETFKLIKK